MTGTAVATLDRKNITALLQSDDARKRIAPMLRGVEYDRVVGEAFLAAADNPDILSCTPASIVRAVARACSWGLAIGEQAYLVPFNVKVSKRGEPDRYEKRLQAIQGYQGKIELIERAGGAKSIDTQVVYAKEPFEYTQGTSPIILHRPAKTAAERGALIGVYAIAHHGYNRPPHVCYLTIEEVDAIRQQYSKQWKQGPVPTWYLKKTSVHQLAKLLPKSPGMARAHTILDQDEDDALPVGGPVATVEAPKAQRIESGEETELDDQWVEQRDSQREAGEE